MYAACYMLKCDVLCCAVPCRAVLCDATHVRTSHHDKVVRGAGTYSKRARWSSDIRLLALDMDGTLLDSNSKVLPSSVKAIQVMQLAVHAGITISLTKIQFLGHSDEMLLAAPTQ